MSRRLPPGFAWKPVSPHLRELTCLVVDGVQVAKITQRINSTEWAVTVHRAREDHRDRPWAIAKDEAQARDWVTRWAVRDEALIREEVAAYNARLSPTR